MLNAWLWWCSGFCAAFGVAGLMNGTLGPALIGFGCALMDAGLAVWFHDHRPATPKGDSA